MLSLLFRCFSLFLLHLRTLAQEKRSQNCLPFGTGGLSLCLYHRSIIGAKYIFPLANNCRSRKKKILANRYARGEQGWRSGESARPHQCVPDPASYVGWARVCCWTLNSAPRGSSPGTPVFLSPQKPTFPKSNSILECTATFKRVLWASWCSVGKQIYIYLSICLTLSACTIGILSTLTYTEFDCSALLAML